MLGRTRNYHEGFVDILKEYEQIHRRFVNPIELGWISVRQFEHTLLEEIQSTSQLLKPLRHITNNKSSQIRDKDELYFSPTQWKIIQDTVLKDATIQENEDNKTNYEIFIIEGNSINKLYELVEQELYQMSRRSGIDNIFHKLSGPLQFDYRLGTDEYKANQFRTTKRREELEQFQYELPIKIRSMLYGSPLFQSLEQDQEQLQQLFNVAQDTVGAKDRILGIKSFGHTTYGRYVSDVESDIIGNHLVNGFNSRDQDRRNYDKRSLGAIDQLADNMEIDVRSAIGMVFNIFRNSTDWKFPDEPPKDIQKVCTDIFKCIFDMEATSTLLVEESYSNDKEYSFQQTINIKKLFDSMISAGHSHGVDLTPSLEYQLKNLEILGKNPLVAQQKYSYGLGNVVHL
jgi:hypothetical protein